MKKLIVTLLIMSLCIISCSNPGPGFDPNTNQKKLVRIQDGAWLGGVCTGIARSYGMDTSVCRVIFGITALAGSVGFWTYVLLWGFVPECSDNCGLENKNSPIGKPTK